ncbi:hypothetical protein SAY87_020615 [Trapa incisa]|uniref:Argininosuccinate lyase C-terminal domain-containing protein n=1 Tax=Trapa incisa TaxID=236973 RepID=A0AAN7PMT5_9MYRT|nr:hypothetical protein SAY87_020615 [Trapa incisa]
MPQKKNPDPMELMCGKSARVVGDLMTLLTLCKGLPFVAVTGSYDKGIPFRTSHDVAVCVGKSCQLQDLMLEDLKSISPAFEEDGNAFLGIENSVIKFSSFGSTGSACVGEQMDYWVSCFQIHDREKLLPIDLFWLAFLQQRQ